MEPRCWQGCASSEGSRGESFFVSFSFWWPWALLGLRLHPSDLCLCLHVAFSVSVPLLLPELLPLDLEPILIQDDPISRSSTISAKTLCPNEVIFRGFRGYIFLGDAPIETPKGTSTAVESWGQQAHLSPWKVASFWQSQGDAAEDEVLLTPWGGLLGSRGPSFSSSLPSDASGTTGMQLGSLTEGGSPGCHCPLLS